MSTGMPFNLRKTKFIIENLKFISPQRIQISEVAPVLNTLKLQTPGCFNYITKLYLITAQFGWTRYLVLDDVLPTDKNNF